jgi:sterol desaturase/sphingolipid hydroxylase (fatty acid hydroxylase superfamily)
VAQSSGYSINRVAEDQAGEGMMQVLNRVLIGLLLLLGVLFVYEGFGFEFRILNFESFDRYAIPFGIALIVAGVLAARFWRVPD